MSVAQAQPQSPLELIFAAQTFVPLLSGALFWPAQNALLVADLHLEKMSSFAKSRQFFPPYDTKATLAKLERDLSETGATRVFSLGDSFHRDEGTTTLQIHDRALIAEFVAHYDWVWIAGNHDPSAHDLGGHCCDELSMDGLMLSHEPDANIAQQIAGHLHPGARIRINGRSTKRPCFVFDHDRLIMPSYGVSTGNLNVLKPAFRPVMNKENMRVFAIGRDQIYPVATKYLVNG
ncbi:ligase-associated DNA damage response endonuclease PdeM [Maritalea myrionectae]|uniref:ligase-associated DNA damage response endonuclease PdeM n=1 Tax=Maritalea myrionectae TaxID=454601 RepID=UPI0003FF956B|nr:ligase-associated DNA damage response endonuclease PdeM [Maritalea myrionectae]